MIILYYLRLSHQIVSNKKNSFSFLKFQMNKYLKSLVGIPSKLSQIKTIKCHNSVAALKMFEIKKNQICVKTKLLSFKCCKKTKLAQLQC